MLALLLCACSASAYLPPSARLAHRARCAVHCSASLGGAVAARLDAACGRADGGDGAEEELRKQAELAAVYAELAADGSLRGFGAAAGALALPPVPALCLPEDQLRLTGLPTSAFAPPARSGFGSSVAGATACTALLLASDALQVDARLLFGAAAAALLAERALLKGALFESAVRALRPAYRRTVVQHEAGHLLVAYLLACPVQDCLIDPWAAMRDGRFDGAAGVVFYDPKLGDGMRKGTLRREDLDRYAVVVMGGIAAEALANGRAEGGQADERALTQLLGSLDGGKSWDLPRVMNQARRGASQALLLLREFEGAHTALCAALERGCSVGEAVVVIEAALDDAFGRNGELPTQTRRRRAEAEAEAEAEAPARGAAVEAARRVFDAERAAEREREISARLASIDRELGEM